MLEILKTVSAIASSIASVVEDFSGFIELGLIIASAIKGLKIQKNLVAKKTKENKKKLS
ncbi:hypothetical protein [Peribacillus muralis]|uniref:hypothetical protein n=1 Tax=Peribacillus muralis TaxID=264697 RepID=UPI000AABB666|nr:hypothetical protein [Peribacillus muralis]